MPEEQLTLITGSGWFTGLLSSVSTLDRLEGDGYLLPQFLSNRLHGKYYSEADSITF